MPRQRRTEIPAVPPSQALVPIDEQVRRLREMLVLMAPETGASALGASFTGYRQRPRKDQRLLPSPHAAKV